MGATHPLLDGGYSLLDLLTQVQIRLRREHSCTVIRCLCQRRERSFGFMAVLAATPDVLLWTVYRWAHHAKRQGQLLLVVVSPRFALLHENMFELKMRHPQLAEDLGTCPWSVEDVDWADGVRSVHREE